MLQATAFGHAVGRDPLNDGRKEWLGGKRPDTHIPIAIRHLDLEVDVAVPVGLGHVLILEELPLAGGGGELQPEDQVVARILAEQGVGPT
ncbi:hypothetical protein D3C86_1704290 [compost metagenome]